MTTKPLNDRTPDNHDHNRNHNHQDKQLADVVQWRCMNCGQLVFVTVDNDPPDICEYCEDMTTWQFIGKPNYQQPY